MSGALSVVERSGAVSCAGGTTWSSARRPVAFFDDQHISVPGLVVLGVTVRMHAEV
ncbi:hypothetical protein [Streptomyces sp. NRRL F-2799]|uniref:hypothetical protein n=1 Tax=Streptomyces sp. NRRL F-2799 TaxID=1463844 RepID=UPI00131A51D4|nr:hypothetical protein [Streptomyces sp. NRRL F-2799]